MVFLPGEVVVDYSLRLKASYDPERLWINGYANDVPCYIPSVRILNEGGYEADTSMWYYDRPTRLDPASEDLIVNAVVAQLPAAFLIPPNTNAPVLVSAASLDGYSVGARFDRTLEQSSAEAPASYQLTPASIIGHAMLRADGKSVSLTLQNAMTGSFTLAANGVMGLWSNAVYSEVQGMRLPLTAEDIGIPMEAGSALAVGNGDIDVRAGGKDIWDEADVLHFIHQQRTGDFDVRVQVASFDGAASSAKAALMVRENLTVGSRHFTLTVYPGQRNWTAFWRLAQDGTSSVASGNWRVPWPGINYPNIWLRLKRTGNQFIVYGGANGHDWIQVADSFTPVPNYPQTVEIGMATTSMSDSYSGVPAAAAEYRNFGDIGLATPPQLSLARTGQLLQFSWPAPASEFQLQQTAVIPGGEWTSISNRPAFFNGQCLITLPAPTAIRSFYRLIGPGPSP